jgi:SulP family sulfate permease
VISGFITASGLLIALSQLKHVLGISAHGHTLIELGASLWAGLPDFNMPTLIMGGSTLIFLLFVRSRLKPLLARLGVGSRVADILTKTGPIFAVVASIAAVMAFDLEAAGVAIVGEVPRGLPAFGLPDLNPDRLGLLTSSALLISIIGFVESVSVGQTLAAKRRQRIDPDQELVGLGASNIAASVSGGYPVTGGFARSVVNFDAGAQTPAAGLFTAIGIALATLFLTPLLYHLPVAVLAATIIVAVLSLVNFHALSQAWAYSRGDFAAMTATIVITLVVGVETGVMAGVGLSLAIFLYQTSAPHSAVVGLVAGTEHFRNVDRHDVVTSPRVVTLRVDRALFFANVRYLEDRVADLVAAHRELEHFILMCPAVNDIDLSALESLEAINQRLADAGISLHLSEVKGPIMDRLKRTKFIDTLSGRVFLSQYAAICALAPEILPRPVTDANRFDGQG